MRTLLPITLSLALVACGNPQAATEQPDEANTLAPATPTPPSAPAAPSAPADDPVPSKDPSTIKPGEPGGLPDDRTPISEGPIDPQSAQGAGQVLQRYGALLEQKKFEQAWALWSDGGKASGASASQFADRFSAYRQIHTEVGAPADPEGAAGSIYTEIPFRMYGTRTDGKPFNLIGKATMRRVNNVPGSTQQQRQWHIQRLDLQPRG